MKKNQNRGFMLTELLVTATIVSTVLIFLYTQFYNIKKSYDNSFKYNSVNSLYVLDNLRSFLMENGDIYANLSYLDIKPYVELLDDGHIVVNKNLFDKLVEKSKIKKLYLTTEDLTILKTYLNNIDGTVEAGKIETLKKFINYADFDANGTGYRLIAEFMDGSFATLLVGGTV